MKKILIIEDEQDIVDISTIILENEGYEVSSLTDFVGYEEVINKCNADLILLDLNIHGYHTNEICKYIKQQDHLKHTKVVIMSAHTDIEAVKIELGADAFISKPFAIKDFLNIISINIC